MQDTHIQRYLNKAFNFLSIVLKSQHFKNVQEQRANCFLSNMSSRSQMLWFNSIYVMTQKLIGLQYDKRKFIQNYSIFWWGFQIFSTFWRTYQNRWRTEKKSEAPLPPEGGKGHVYRWLGVKMVSGQWAQWSVSLSNCRSLFDGSLRFLCDFW